MAVVAELGSGSAGIRTSPSECTAHSGRGRTRTSNTGGGIWRVRGTVPRSEKAPVTSGCGKRENFVEQVAFELDLAGEIGT